MRLPAALILPFLIGFSRCVDGQGNNALPFSVSLTEQKSEQDATGSRYVTVTGFLSCPDPEDQESPTCTYNISTTNNAVNSGFTSFLMNGFDCPCHGTLTKSETAVVTVYKTGRLRMDLVKLQLNPPQIIVLGCSGGLNNGGGCSRITQTYDDPDYGYDAVCACSSSKLDACDQMLVTGPCLDSKVTWWVADSAASSSTMSTARGTPSTTHSSVSSSSMPTTTPFSTTTDDSDDDFSFDVTLTETNNNDEQAPAGKITVTMTMTCTEDHCGYTATSNPVNYFEAAVDGQSCSGHPSQGHIQKGASILVVLRRLGQRLNLIQINYFDKPEVLILGCSSGMLEVGKCFQMQESPQVGTDSYHDLLCSCRDNQGHCDSAQVGRCDGNYPVWWEDDSGSTSTSVSTPSPDPNVFDLSFMLSEGQVGANPSASVMLKAFMNCSETACQYSVDIVDYQQTYFTIKVNDLLCPASKCDGIFLFGKKLRVTATRLSEVLEMFDLEYFSTPNVVVLGCADGFVNRDFCVQTSFFDQNIQLDTTFCTCSDTVMSCNAATAQGQCATGAPVGWIPEAEYYSTPTTAMTTSTPDSNVMTFMITLSEGNTNGDDDSFKNLKADVVLRCDEENCTYQISLSTDSQGYYSVLAGDRKCGDKCDSSFTSLETINVRVLRKGEVLDWFDLVYNNAIIMSCASGLLDEKECLKIENQDKNLNEVVCTCMGEDDRCAEADAGACLPVWWKPDPNTVVTTTADPSLYSERFVLSLSEQDASQESNPVHFLSVIVSMNCTMNMCTLRAAVMDPDQYFQVKLEGIECFTLCMDYLGPGESKVLSANRRNEHLNLVAFRYDEPRMSIVGCSDLEKSDGEPLGEGVKCVKMPNAGVVDTLHYDDQLCACQGDLQSTCDVNTPLGQCKNGQMTWWQSDVAPTSSAAKTTTVELNHFAMEVTLTEKTKRTADVLQEIIVSSSMSCTSEMCSYEIGLGPYDPNYFGVFIGNLPYSDATREGSFVKGKSVNVTLRRGDQLLDLFDYEFVDISRAVVLACEDGLSDYGQCIKSTQDVQIEGVEYFDEVCSCRSAGANQCDAALEGVCRKGYTKWWRDVDESTSTSVQTTSESSTSLSTSPSSTSTPSTTTVPTTTAAPIPSLQELSDNGVDLTNVTQVLNDTLHYSSQGATLNGTQVFEITKVLHKSANVKEISAENAKQILRNMDECLNAHEDELRSGQTKDMRLLDVLKPMVRNTKDAVIHFLDGQNMGFGAKKVDCSNIDSDDGLIDYGPDIGFRPLNDTNRLSATQQNSIIVPLKQVCGNQEVTHVFFTIYRHQKLFTGNQTYRVYGADTSPDASDNENLDEGTMRRRFRRDADTNDTDTIVPIPPPGRCEQQISIPQQASVLSAVLMDSEGVIERLKTDGDATSAVMASVQFNVGKMPLPLHANVIVSWFDTALSIWSLNNQCTVKSIENGIVQADCEHLTDFSALIQGQINSENVCSVPLIIVSYVVNGISLSCLLILIAVGSLYYIHGANTSKLLIWVRGHVPPKGDVVNLAYHTVFFVFFILSMFFMDQSNHEQDLGESSTYCVVIAAVAYFCLISAIQMSMLIGIRMVCHFFPPKLRVFFRVMTSPPAALSIGLAIPLCFTLALAIFETAFFKRNDGFCWIRPDYTTYAVVIPVSLPIVNGVLCSTFAVYKMFFQARRGLASKETKHHDAEFWSKVLGLIMMQVAMGLPWGIEFMIIGFAGPSPWNYVFVVLFGTQGIDLFLIFLYRRHRLVSESKKWSAREQRLDASQENELRHRKETRATTFMGQ